MIPSIPGNAAFSAVLIAAQEGWLTEGESGVTGVSIDRIFEFPKEERRRTKRVKRITVGSGPASPNNCPDPDARENSQPGALICTDFGPYHSGYNTEASTSQRTARQTYADESVATNWEIHWRTRVRSVRTNNGQTVTSSGTAGARFLTLAQWTAKAEAAAVNACRARGARYVDGSADFGPGHSDDAGEGDRYHGANLGWFYAVEEHSTSPASFAGKPGKAAPGRPSARKPSAAPGGRGLAAPPPSSRAPHRHSRVSGIPMLLAEDAAV